MKNQNILVTGGAGYIGSITCQELQKAGFTPIIFDSLEKGHQESVKGFKLIVGQTHDWKLVARVLKDEKISAVIHFAAYIEMGESMKDPQKYFFNNIIGSLSLFRAMIEAGVDKLVFSSTAGVYGDPARLPVKEEDVKNPTNPYGESKLTVEKILRWYDKAYGLRSISLRYFNAAGAALDGSLGEDHHPESHLIPNILKSILQEKPFTLHGTDYKTSDGSCIRDYIHVLDLAQAHIKSLEALNQGHKTDVYNIGTGKGFSNKGIIAKVEEITGRKVKIDVGPRRPGDADELVADSSKFQAEFDWQPKYSDLETIIKTAWLWQQKVDKSKFFG